MADKEKGFFEQQLPGAPVAGRYIDRAAAGVANVGRRMYSDYGTWGGLGRAVNRDANAIRRVAGVPERQSESLSSAVQSGLDRQFPPAPTPTVPPVTATQTITARGAAPAIGAQAGGTVYSSPSPPIRTTPTQNVLATPLLTNQGEGGPRVEYPNDYTRQAYSTPDTAAIQGLMRRTPTAQEYAAERLGPANTQDYGTTKLSERGSFTSYRDANGAQVYQPNTFTQGAGGPSFTYMRPGQNLDPRQQPPPQAEPARPRSSFEDIALGAARNAVQNLAPQIQYRTVRDGRGNPVQVRVPSTVQDIDPNRIYSDTLSTLRHGEPSGGDILQADVAREGAAASERRYGQQGRDEMERARMGLEGQKYSADKSYEAATARNETAKEREQRLSDSPEDKAFIEMQKDEFKYLSPEDKAKLGSNPREQWLSFIGKNMAATQGGAETAKPVRRQLKTGEWVDVVQDASGNWVPVGGR